ncbi:thioesterase II family protein [Roseiflexus sp.]|jgi:medium-chain acyl-[acyl-carrier-protein] hydrolase
MRYPPDHKRWIVRFGAGCRPAVRLICLPHSGAGASSFAGWTAALPDWIEVCAVQLPGHETRYLEPLCTSIPSLINAMAPALLPVLLDCPTAFFGHSMGALLAFELARQLRREAGVLPRRLYLSAHRAAHLPARHPPTHTLPDDELWALVQSFNGTSAEVLAHPELRQIFLPILRADFTACETYVYQPDQPLECPVVACGGLEDDSVTPEELESWRVHTSADFRLRLFPGGHFYPATSQLLLHRMIIHDLAECL